ncbi:MAG: Mur ligase family protein [Planctomycetota bacterium]
MPDPDDGSPDAYRAALSYLYQRINYEKNAGKSRSFPFRLQKMHLLARRLGLADWLCPPHWLSDYSPESPAINDVTDGSWAAAEQSPLVVNLDGVTGFPHPPSRPLIIHLAGTKGKGSTASMLASILSAAGLRTGLYTSPHLHSLQERFRIDGKACSDEELVRLVDQVHAAVDSILGEQAVEFSFFELTTAIGMLHFHAKACDAVILEVGLGGRLDSTNICQPDVTAITTIGLDHTHVLGDTLNKIAREKAGIIKPGIPIVCGVQPRRNQSPDVADGVDDAVTGERHDDPAAVIASIAKHREAPLIARGIDFDFRFTQDPRWGGDVEFVDLKSETQRRAFGLALEGDHQASNASLAIAVCDQLTGQGVDITDADIAAGLETVECAARVERLDTSDEVTLIVDSAHNADSVDAICRCVSRRFSDRPTMFVFGTSHDKDAAAMLSRITSESAELILTQYASNPRFTPAEKLHALLRSGEFHVDRSMADAVPVCPDPIEACRRAIEWASTEAVSAKQQPGVVVILGSFFLAAEVRPWLLKRSIPHRPPALRSTERSPRK